MIDLFDLYKDFGSRVNIQQGGWFRPQTDFVNACNVISNELWEHYTNMAEKSQEVKDNLFPFLKSKNIIVDNKGIYGTFPSPKEYGRFATARIIVTEDHCVPCKEVDNGSCTNGDFKTPEELTEDYYDTVTQYEVDLVDTNKWAAMNQHKTKKPTILSPKIRQVNGVFQVAPRKVSVIVLDYYVKPKNATFEYTNAPGNVQTGAGDQIIYNQKDSKPLEWPETMRGQFLDRLQTVYSQFTRDQMLAQLNNQPKKQA